MLADAQPAGEKALWAFRGKIAELTHLAWIAELYCMAAPRLTSTDVLVHGAGG